MDNNIIDKRTKGEWDYGYGDSSNSFGIFTKKMLDEGLLESPICLISPIDKMTEVDKANAAFIVKACNEYDKLVENNKLLLEALKETENYFDKQRNSGKFSKRIRTLLKNQLINVNNKKPNQCITNDLTRKIEQ